MLSPPGWAPTDRHGRAVWSGFGCSLVLAVAGAVVGAVPKAGQRDAVGHALHLESLRANGPARVVATVAAFCALAGLLACWWALRRHLSAAPAGATWVVAALWAAPLLFAPPMYSADVYAYAGQGHLVDHGVDPYTYGPGGYEATSPWSFNIDGLWRYSPSPYGPVWLWLSGRVVGLSGGHVHLSVYLFRGLAVVGWLCVAWAATRLSRSLGMRPGQALWLSFLNPLVLVHGLGGAHNDMLMVGLMAAGLALAVPRASLAATASGAVLITLAALVKVPAVVALAFLPLLVPMPSARRATALVAAAAGAATALAVVAATGLGWRWLHVLGADHGARSVWSVSTWVASLAGRGASLALLVLVVAAVWVAALRGRDPWWCLGVALLALFLLGPMAQPWYLLWALLPLAVGAGERTRTTTAVLSATLLLCLVPGGRSWVRPPFYGTPVLAAAVVVSAVALRQRHQQRQQQLVRRQVPVTAP